MPCEPGYYQSTPGSKDCIPCPAGYYCRVGVVVRVMCGSWVTCVVVRVTCGSEDDRGGSESDMCSSENNVW